MPGNSTEGRRVLGKGKEKERGIIDFSINWFSPSPLLLFPCPTAENLTDCQIGIITDIKEIIKWPAG